MQANNMYNNVAVIQNIFEQTKNNQQIFSNMQSNVKGNNLYSNSFQQTWNNFQLNADINKTNMNNMLNILALINFPILVPYHSQHPLINCYTPDRAKQYGNWYCDICKNSYTYNVPSFFCTACQFDLCQKCLLSLQTYQIVIYDFKEKIKINPNEKFENNSKYINLKVHPHPIFKIKRENTQYILDLKCEVCRKTLQLNEEFYYCSLCNFYICINCHKAKCNNNIKNNFVINPDYLSGEQMNNNNNFVINPDYLSGEQMNNNNNFVINPDYLSGEQMAH